MKAEEMFKDCGWEKQEDRLAYWKDDECIAFLQTFRTIHFFVAKEDGKIFTDYICAIGAHELLAIVKQCIELGWMGETE